MSLHANIATDGVRQGHKLFSVLGIGFQVIIVSPKDSGGWPGYRPSLDKYVVTVVIKRNGKVWKQSFDSNLFGMKTLEKVMISFKSINKIIESIAFHISSPIIRMKKVIVEVKRGKRW